MTPLIPVPEQAHVSLPNAFNSRAGSRLDLNFTLDGAITRMYVPVQQPPWQAIRAFQNSERQAVVHLHNISGGILSGDRLHLSIHADAFTRAQVTSVGATRIYRARDDGQSARLITSIRVASGALLEYLPDVTIPFRGSRFSQSTTVSLASDAGFIGWDILAAGRIASGEAFSFDTFHSECSVLSDVRPLSLERYRLKPSLADMTSSARWGRFRYTTALYVCHTGVAPSRWIDLESSLNQVAFARSSPAVRWGVSTLAAGGLIIRGLALEAHQIADGLHMFWKHAKKEIWGEQAIAPRKIN
ncbi:MAG: urease accessory protein UreD [Acidobacteriota bacterium]|nr:urease accessory protein UreD [Acidobacteriota bacterium]